MVRPWSRAVWEGLMEAIQYNFIYVMTHNIHFIFIQFIYNYNSGTVTITMQPDPLLVDKPGGDRRRGFFILKLSPPQTWVSTLPTHLPAEWQPPTGKHSVTVGRKKPFKQEASSSRTRLSWSLTVCFIRSDTEQLPAGRCSTAANGWRRIESPDLREHEWPEQWPTFF